jgi:hypothetical protein
LRQLPLMIMLVQRKIVDDGIIKGMQMPTDPTGQAAEPEVL